MEQTDLQGMLGALTQNPELMGKLRQIAKGLAAGQATPPSQSSDTEATPQTEPAEEASILPASHGHRLMGDFGARKQLLSALRPYLHEKRRKKLDEILNLICLLEAAEKSGLLSQFLGGTKERQEEHHVSS